MDFLQENSLTITNTDENDVHNQNYSEIIISKLPKSKGWMTDFLFNYQGMWLTMAGLKGVISVQRHFTALSSDILLATFPKSGTTWLKALVFSIVNRKKFNSSSHPLLDYGPHDCVKFLEAIMSQKPCFTDSKGASSPRLFATHIPYPSLPESVKAFGCKIIYLYRDPKDVLVSCWYYLERLRAQELPPLSLEEAFEMFMEGITHYGPFWDHVIGYWNASLESHKNILFLSYEDLKIEPSIHVKKMAEFLDCPFSIEEERGMVEEITRFCGFENLSNLEVNKIGVQRFTPEFVVENKSFFRKGEVGDWKNHLTDEMIKRLDQMTLKKLSGTNLTFHH